MDLPAHLKASIQPAGNCRCTKSTMKVIKDVNLRRSFLVPNPDLKLHAGPVPVQYMEHAFPSVQWPGAAASGLGKPEAVQEKGQMQPLQGPQSHSQIPAGLIGWGCGSLPESVCIRGPISWLIIANSKNPIRICGIGGHNAACPGISVDVFGNLPDLISCTGRPCIFTEKTNGLHLKCTIDPNRLMRTSLHW